MNEYKVEAFIASVCLWLGLIGIFAYSVEPNPGNQLLTNSLLTLILYTTLRLIVNKQ
jgi:hypothetical protein